MSFNGFKSLFDGQSTRLERVRVLASPTDIPTGIVDYVTICNKAYFENVGPTSTTGTALAAIIDLYDVLQGRVTDQPLNALDILKVSGSAVSVGGAAVADKIFSVIGDATIDGTFSVTGASSLSDTSVDGDLTVVSGNSFINEDGTFKVKEPHIPAILGQVRNLTVLDEYSNFLVDLYTGSRYATNPTNGHAANFGLKYGSAIPFYVSESGGVFSGNGFGINEIPTTLARGFHTAGFGGVLGGMTFYSPKFGETGGAHNGGFMINSVAEWVPGSDGGTASLGASIVHAYNDGGSNIMMFMVGGDSTLMLEKDKATVSGGTGYAIDFTVRSFYGEPNEYFTRLHPSYPNLAIRCIGNSVSPALQVGGCHSGKTLRVGFDAWHDHSIGRFYMDTQSTANCIPAVAIGKPLGTYADPCDNLIVSDSPWLVAMNTNVRALAANHGDKQGVFVGRGLAGTNDHKMGVLWLEDYTGYSAAIHFGTNIEHSYAFVKNGVMKTHTNSDDSHSRTDGLGTTYIGAHRIPYFVTEYNATTDRATIVDEIVSNGVSEEVNGAAVAVLSNDDQSLTIFIYSSAVSGWYSFNSTTHTS